jgi:type IV secretion system protein VirB9
MTETPRRFLSRAVPLVLLAVAAGPALAEPGRVATRPYVENAVENVATRPGFQSTIVFGDGERIENIALGDSAEWQVTPNRRSDLVFVKPVSGTAPLTNMTVVTNRHTYLFELRTTRTAAPVYMLRFAYPAPPTPVATATAAIGEPGAVAAASPEAPDSLPVDRLNFAWSVSGARALYPDRVFDDGKAIYLAWQADRALPAILAPAPDGKSEGPVNFTSSGRYLVVDGTYSRLILRSGKQVATLETAVAAPARAAQAPAVSGAPAGSHGDAPLALKR